MYSWYDMIQKMKDLVDGNIENGPSLSEMDKKLRYPYYYATKKFHEIKGISFREYILKYKIQKSVGVLYTTNERMIDAAIK